MTDDDSIKERAQDAQQQVAQSAQARVREQVDARSTQAAEQANATAHALRATSDKLRDEGQDAPARAAEQLAGHAERLGGYLSESDGERILHDLEDLGRRQPLAAIGVGLVAGLAASRLLRASSRGRYERRQSTTPTPPSTPHPATAPQAWGAADDREVPVVLPVGASTAAP